MFPRAICQLNRRTKVETNEQIEETDKMIIDENMK